MSLTAFRCGLLDQIGDQLRPSDVKRLTKQMQEVRWLVGWIIKELASEANKKQVAFDKVYQVYQCSQVQRKRLQRL
jgi:hypothetical protein